MFLKSLEISGFKSFAHKTVFNFSPGVTAIVGPNGSGKSNIAEAIRWVMGEQSLKSIRSKEGADLIFHGSNDKARLNKAQVSLIFDNSLKKMPIDFDEVIISRVVYRDGTNEYYINNNQVRLKDIVDLLVSSNIGQRNFSVISQGLSDSLIKLNPQELKLVIEDAAGIRPTEIKKEDAIKKLKLTKENIEKVNLMKSEITPYLRNLKKQVSKLEKKDEMELQLKELKEKKIGCEINRVHKLKEKLLSEECEFKNIISDTDKKIKNLQNEIEKLDNELKVNNNLMIEIDNQIDHLQEERLKYEKAISVVEGKIELENEKRKLVLSIDWNYVKDRLKSVLSALEEMLNNEMNFKKDNLINIFNSLKGLFEEICLGYRQENDNKNDIKEIQSKELLAEKEKLLKTLEIFKKDLENAKQKLRNLKEAEQPKKDKLFEFERLVRELTDKKIHSEEKLRNITKDIQNFDIKEKVIKDQYPDIASFKEIDISEEELAKIELEIARLERILAETSEFDKNLIEEYNKISERYEFLDKEYKDLEAASNDLNKLIKELNITIDKQFNEAFLKINEKFDLYFKMIFAGGKAKLSKIQLKKEEDEKEKEDENENNEEFKDKKQEYGENDYGIEIKAELPGKKAYNLNMFSGGERSLTAIALLFALISNANPPFIVLDEIDAALDEANSRRFASIFREFVDKTQFIIITHNRETMSHAKILYGITMGSDSISKVFSLKLEDVIK